jgi:hypothetical protein
VAPRELRGHKESAALLAPRDRKENGAQRVPLVLTVQMDLTVQWARSIRKMGGRLKVMAGAEGPRRAADGSRPSCVPSPCRGPIPP